MTLKSRLLAALLFCLMWAVVWRHPGMRVLLRVHLDQICDGADTSSQSLAYSEPTNFTELLQKHPDDIELAVAAAYYAGLNKKGVERAMPYDTVLRRHPNESWIIANRLQTVLYSLTDDRLAGGFEGRTRLYIIPSPEKSTHPTNVTAAELEAARKLARHGVELEPDNSFYPLIQLPLLLAAHRDQEAFDALHQAAQQPRYDDHWLELTRALIYANELTGRPLTWEQKHVLDERGLSIAYGLRHSARIISWEAWKRESAGDHAVATRLRLDLAKMTIAVLLGRSSNMAPYWSAPNLQEAWGGSPARDLKRPTRRLNPEELLQRDRQQNQLFIDYAKAHGYPAIAAEASETYRQVEPALKIFRYRDDIPYQSGSRVTFLLPIWSEFALGPFLIAQLLVIAGSIFWLRLAVIRRPLPPIDRKDGRSSIAIGTTLNILFCLIVYAINFHSLRLSNIDVKHPGLYLFESFFIWNVVAQMSLMFLMVAPLAATAIACWGATRRRTKIDRQNVAPAPEPAVEEVNNQLAAVRDLRPRIAAIYTASMLAMSLLCCLGWAVLKLNNLVSWVQLPERIYHQKVTDLTDACAGLAFLFLLAWVIAFMVKHRLFTPPDRQARTLYALVWQRQTLWPMLLVSSALYLAFGLASLGPRRQAGREFEEYLRKGEMTMLLERVKR